jgi:hypothetical protein
MCKLYQSVYNYNHIKKNTVLRVSKLALFKNYDCYDVTNYTLFLSYYVYTVQWKQAC